MQFFGSAVCGPSKLKSKWINPKGQIAGNSEFLKMFSIVSVEIYISFKLHATLEDLVFARPPKKMAIYRCDHTGNITYSRVASAAGAKLWSQVLLSRHFLGASISRFDVSLKVTERGHDAKKWLKNHLQVVGGWLK